MLVKKILSELESALKDASFETPALEASLLLADSLEIPHLELALHSGRRLLGSEEKRIRSALERRLKHEPLQYIFGVAHFRFLRLKAGPGCLVPRPETELLADFVLQMAPKGGMVCELGAGSGALGLSIASERPDLGVKASELSPEAFKWADLNRRELSLPNYELFSGDLFSPFAGLRFDVVAANLPYISSAEMPALPDDVRLWEPAAALDGGPDGLDIIRRALAAAPDFLKPGGRVVFEAAETHGPALLEILGSDPRYAAAEIRKDLCGKERFAVASTRA